MRCKMFHYFALCLLVSGLLLGSISMASAQDNWYWLSSDNSYSKFFDPHSVVTVETAQTSHGTVPTMVDVWTKTNYSYTGAQETLSAYGLNFNPAQLSFSTALMRMSPQLRTVQYMQENFYDPQGKIIWSNTNPGKVKEINSQQFDEAFYTATMDQAFHQLKETERAKASDRWLTIGDVTAPDGVNTHTTADTSTMRMRGNNLVFWEWQEVKNANGQVTEIRFMKMSMNLPQSTQKIVTGRYWSPSSGWQSMDSNLDGEYHMIPSDSKEYQEVETLRQYVTAHEEWVNRYRVD